MSMSYRFILYQDFTKHVMTFSYMILLQFDISQEPKNALFNSNQKQKKAVQALLFGGCGVGSILHDSVIWCHKGSKVPP